MTWEEAVDLLVSQTRHEHYRWLCSDANPDERSRLAYRGYAIRKATQTEEDIKVQRYVQKHGRCC